VVLAQISVQRVRAGLRQQGLEHHVPSPTLREMLAIGLAQAADEGVAVLLVDAASAANLKFLSVWPQVRHGNFKFKAALETDNCWSSFDSEVRI